jgi:hypothetical protein
MANLSRTWYALRLVDGFRRPVAFGPWLPFRYLDPTGAEAWRANVLFASPNPGAQSDLRKWTGSSWQRIGTAPVLLDTSGLSDWWRRFTEKWAENWWRR